MLLLRSAIFYLFVGAVSAAFMPAFLLAGWRRGWRWPLTRAYLTALMWGFRSICRLDYRVIGAGNLPEGACLIASAQQSSWESMAFPLIFANPAVWTKTELYRMPVAAWIARANDYIPTDRSGDIASVKAGMENARRQIAAGRSVLIYPEGTRNTVAGQAKLRKGVGALYTLLDRPCVPVALNSGRHWRYGSYLIRPGTITVEVLAPIAPRLPRPEFEERLKATIDAATLRLMAAADVR